MGHYPYWGTVHVLAALVGAAAAAATDGNANHGQSPCTSNASLLWVRLEGARLGEAGSMFSVCAPKCTAQDRAGVCLRWRSASVCRPFAHVDGTGTQTVCVLPCVTTQDCAVHHWRLSCVGRVCAFPEM